MARPEHIIVGCLDPLTAETMQRIPRHVTIVPWFSVDEEIIPTLISECEKIVAQHEPLEVIGQNEDYFGPNHDIKVRLVEKTVGLSNLHNALLGVVNNRGGRVRAHAYAGQGYNPHVSEQEDGFFDAGERHLLQSVQLIEATTDKELKRRVIGQWAFGGKDEN